MLKTLILLTSFFSSTLFAQSLQTPIDNIVNKIDPHINMGMMVVDLHTGETLYQHAVTKPLIPASNMKIFSDAAALLALGPDYRFQTQLSTDASAIKSGTLQGSLYLSFSGDPTLTTSHLISLFAQLKELGVTKITGSVVLVSPYAKVTPQPPGVMQKDLNYSYGASLVPLIINENRVTVTVNPSCQAGQRALVEHSEPNGSFVLDNQVNTTAGSSKGISFATTSENVLTVRGNIGQGQSAIQGRIPVKNPFKHAEALVKICLKRQGIDLDGPILLGPKKTSLLLATHYSRPLTEILAETLKPSDNLYANTLFLHTANHINGAPVNWEQAETIIKNYLQKETGINMQTAVMVDGSGLSRHDLLSAEQTVSLLKYLYERFPLSYEYIAALPISGQDGTLQRRFKNPNQKGFIRAKTGSMAGITSLSGYLYTANAHTLAFTMYINTRRGTSPNVSGRYRTMMDQICDFLLKQKPHTLKRITVPKDPHAHVAYQHFPSDADRQRAQVGKWRRIEFALKQSLKNYPATIVFRGNQLKIIDRSPTAQSLWPSIQKIARQYPIAVTLVSANPPPTNSNIPLIWRPDQASHQSLIWTLHDRVS